MNTINLKKRVITSFLLMNFVVFYSCNKPNTASINLKEDTVQREKVFDQILNDRELTNEFMNQMMQNTQSMHLIF